MTPLFDRNRHQLSDGEKEMLWRRILEGERAPRRRPWWGRLALSASLLLAAVLVVTQMDDPLPEKPPQPLSILADGTGQPDEGGSFAGSDSFEIELRLAAAPDSPEATPSVAPPRAGDRAAAAPPPRGDSDSRPEEGKDGTVGIVVLKAQDTVQDESFSFGDPGKKMLELAERNAVLVIDDWQRARMALEAGSPAALRGDRLVERFPVEFSGPVGEGLVLRLTGAPSPVDDDRWLLRVAIRTGETAVHDLRVEWDFPAERAEELRLPGTLGKSPAPMEGMAVGGLSEGGCWVRVLELERRRALAVSPWLGDCTLRYRTADSDQTMSLSLPVTEDLFAASFDAADPGLRLSLLAAELGDCLARQGCTRVQPLIDRAEALQRELPGDPRVKELLHLLRLAADRPSSGR